jgi:hypothetical protein
VRELRAPSESPSNQPLPLAPIPVLLALSVLLTVLVAGSAPEVLARPSFQSPVSPVESPEAPTEPAMDSPTVPPDQAPVNVPPEVPTAAPAAESEVTMDEELVEEDLPEEEASEEPADTSSMVPAWDAAVTCLSGFSYVWLACGVMALCVVPLAFILLSVLGANARTGATGTGKD